MPDNGETRAESIRRFHQAHNVPILNALKKWLDEIEPNVLPNGRLEL